MDDKVLILPLIFFLYCMVICFRLGTKAHEFFDFDFDIVTQSLLSFLLFAYFVMCVYFDDKVFELSVARTRPFVLGEALLVQK
jgi:hypothetical protein